MTTSVLFPFGHLTNPIRFLIGCGTCLVISAAGPVAFTGPFGGDSSTDPIRASVLTAVGAIDNEEDNDKGREGQEALPVGSPLRMDYGPVIGHSFRFPEMGLSDVGRGMAIELAHGVTVLFDTAQLRYVVAKVEGRVDLTDTDYMRTKGNTIARLTGSTIFNLSAGAGGSNDDVFSNPDNGRPLPKSEAEYSGCYRFGDRVVLAYRIDQVPVLELPTAVNAKGRTAFVRHIRIGKSSEPLTLRLSSVETDPEAYQDQGDVWAPVGDTRQWIGLHGGPEGAHPVITEGEARLHVPPRSKPTTFQVLLARIPEGEFDVTKALRAKLDTDVEVQAMTKGGPLQWPQRLQRSGERADDDAAYVVDSIPVPQKNPWHSFMRISGLDFFSDGRAAVCTMNGDVWIVGGLDEQLQGVSWNRYASGLYEPMGLEIREDEIFVTEQGRITRLHDLNDDGEADFYENFNNQGAFKPRAYWLNLASDSRGRFYYNKVGNRARNTPEHGCLMRVTAGGESANVFATGLRQANGLAISSADTIHTTDQEGNWVPATRIDRIEEGKFYGYRPNAGREIPVGRFSKPICWLPQNVDNSAGSQVFVDDERWGPLAGRWLHTSWGLARLFLLLTETVQGVEQGGVVNMPTGLFRSGIMRAEVNPTDGQVYVAGLGVPGWTGVSFRHACFNRARYTGLPTSMPVGLHARTDGVEIVFKRALAPKQARNPKNYTVKRWGYRYSEEYGSPEYSVADPEATGRDPVEVSEVSIGKQGRGVLLHIPDMQPVMQMMIEYDIESKNGRSMKNTIYHTVHRLRPVED